MSCVCFQKNKVRPVEDLQVSTERHHHSLDHGSMKDEDNGWKAKLVNNAREKRVVFRMIGLTIIPILVLISLNIVNARDAISTKKAMEDLKDRIKSSMEDFGGLIHRLQIERGTTALYISSGSDEILNKLRRLYNVTDEAIANVSVWNAGPSLDYFKTKETFKKHIEEYRLRVEPNSTTLPALRDNMKFYTDKIDEIIRWFDLSDVKVATSHKIWGNIVGYEMLVKAKEQNGVQRALGSTYYAMGGFRNHSMYLWFMEENLLGTAFLESSMFYCKFVKEKYNQNLKSNNDLISSIKAMENEIKQNDYANLVDSWKRGDFWFTQMTFYINMLFDTQLKLADVILSDLDNDIAVRQVDMVTSVVVMVGVFLISPVILHAIVVQTQKIQHFSATLEEKTRELEVERGHSDRLLHQMLPASIAMELKSGGTVSAEYYDEATIFFSDVVNFTRMCAESTPMQVSSVINTIIEHVVVYYFMFD